MNIQPIDLHPDTLERFFERAQDLVATQDPEARRDPRLREALGQAFAQYLAPRRRAIVWRHVEDKGGKSYFEIGREGEPLVAFHTGERCVWWLWKAIDDKGVTNTLRARDFASPHAKAPDESVRKALRTTAPKVVGRFCPALALEIDLLAKRVIVEDGLIHFRPSAHTPRILTR